MIDRSCKPLLAFCIGWLAAVASLPALADERRPKPRARRRSISSAIFSRCLPRIASAATDRRSRKGACGSTCVPRRWPAAKSGTTSSPGKGDESLLVKALAGTTDEVSRMPEKGEPLSAARDRAREALDRRRGPVARDERRAGQGSQASLGLSTADTPRHSAGEARLPGHTMKSTASSSPGSKPKGFRPRRRPTR